MSQYVPKPGDKVIVRISNLYVPPKFGVGVIEKVAAKTIHLTEEPQGMYRRRFKLDEVRPYNERVLSSISAAMRAAENHRRETALAVRLATETFDAIKEEKNG